MRHGVMMAVLVLGVLAISPAPNVEPVAAAARSHIFVTDDCDPNADWGTGGCLREEGSVSRAEFNAFLLSAFSSAVVGHPSWRNEPGYLTLDAGQRLKVKNTGGRTHTFTEVTHFGGGRVAPLNTGLVAAPECATSVDMAPGASTQITGLGLGNHSFQCCIHPWMRAVVEVVPEE